MTELTAIRAGMPSPQGRVTLVWHEFRYHVKRYRRTWRGTVVVSIVNPLLFLIAMGVGLGRVVDPHPLGLHGVNYLAFFAPGMLAAAAMQNGIIEAGFPVAAAVTRRGNYKVAAATPLASTEIMLGHLLFMALRIAMSAAAFVIVMVVFGATKSPLVVLAIPAALLTGLAFSAPTAAWAVTLKGPEAVRTLFKWVVMPLYLFSGTFFPIDHMPFVLRLLAYVTPLWHGVDLCRSLSTGSAGWGMVALHVCYLTTLVIGGLIAISKTYRRRLYV